MKRNTFLKLVGGTLATSGDVVKKQVAQSGGWLLLTSKDPSVLSLLETGKRLQRLFLKIRERNIAMHPM